MTNNDTIRYEQVCRNVYNFFIKEKTYYIEIQDDFCRIEKDSHQYIENTLIKIEDGSSFKEMLLNYHLNGESNKIIDELSALCQKI